MSTATQPVESKPKLITRKDMIAMTGLSRTKVHNLTLIKGFPKIQGKRDREYLWDEQAVLAWFKANNPNETAAPRPIPKYEIKPQALDNGLARIFLTRQSITGA